MFSFNPFLAFLFHLLVSDFVTGIKMNLEDKTSQPSPLSSSTLTNVEQETSNSNLLSSSPLLPNLEGFLSKQKNSPDTSSKFNKEYDYIIVGAGTAGSVVAARLSEISCISVLLLEAGSSAPKLNDIVAYSRNFFFTDLNWQYETTAQKHTGSGLIKRKLKWPSGKGLGGTTLLNGGIHVRGNKKDYDDWAAMGAEGWSYEKILPYLKKLEDNINSEYVKNGYHGVGGPITVEKPRYTAEVKPPILQAAKALGYNEVDPNAGRQTGFYDVQANLRDAQRCSTAKAYLVPAENRTNLHILPRAFVRKVIIENGRATGVLFDHNGQTHQVRVNREVILSAGAVKTPQILMLSGVGPEELLRKFNIPVHANLPAGSNLQDHGGISLDFALKPSIEEFSVKLTDPRYITQYLLNKTGPVASVEGLSYLAFLLHDEINPEIDYPNYQLYIGENSASGVGLFWNLKPEVYQQVYGPYQNRPIMSCITQILHPKSRGVIQINSANPYDHPVIDPNYLADPRDVEDFVDGMKTCKKICNTQEMKQVITEPFQTRYPGCEEYANNEDEYFRCVLRTVLITFSHYCCTAKMGDVKNTTTVVDYQLRVKNIKNLRVADASVMPKIISGNTGVPVIMIGEKAADLIKETIQCK